MTKEDWLGIKHFSTSENWGDPFKMEKELLIKLDRLREKVGKPFVIHCGYEESGHSSKSYHYKGMAVDLHILNCSLREQWEYAMMGEFNGVGYYPFWNNPGLHLDIRQEKLRWYRDKGGEYHYQISDKYPFIDRE